MIMLFSLRNFLAKLKNIFFSSENGANSNRSSVEEKTSIDDKRKVNHKSTQTISSKPKSYAEKKVDSIFGGVEYGKNHEDGYFSDYKGSSMTLDHDDMTLDHDDMTFDHMDDYYEFDDDTIIIIDEEDKRGVKGISEHNNTANRQN